MRAALALVLMLAACGNDPAPPKDCLPPQGELPSDGAYIDPYAFQLDGCVEGGLRELPGRWFLRDTSQFFQFEYPQYEGSCDAGYHPTSGQADDHDASDPDGHTFYTWTDGTRYFERERQVYNGDEVYVTAKVFCRKQDDTLAVAYGRSYTGPQYTGEKITNGLGTRFYPKDAEASGIDYVGELGQSQGHQIMGLNLVIEGSYAYVVGELGFDVIDVSDPSAPVSVGHIDGSFNDVRIVHGSTNTVAIAAPFDGDKTSLIDVTTPTAPVLSNVIPAYSHSVQTRVVGATTELYLADYTDSVPRYDVTNPLAPVKLSTTYLPGNTITGVHDLTVYGNFLYVNNTDAGFVAVDVSGGFTHPVERGRIRSGYSHASWAGQIDGREIVLHGDEGMDPTTGTAAFMRVLDGDPSSATYMQVIGTYRSRPEVGIHNIEVHGTRAYISYYQDGVRIVELADPEHPAEVAHYNTWNPDASLGEAFEGAVGLRKVGDYLYVADLERGLIILREQ